MYRLIIADDEQDIREGLSGIVPWREWGYRVEACMESGEDVIRHLRENDVDVALLDIVMGSTSGLDVAKWIHETGRRTRVVLLSGHSDFQYARQAIRYGIKDYLLKPTDMDEMLRVFDGLRQELDLLKEERLASSDALKLLLLSPQDKQARMRVFGALKGPWYAMAVVRFADADSPRKAERYLSDQSWPDEWRVARCVCNDRLILCAQMNHAGEEGELARRVKERAAQLNALFSMSAALESISGAPSLEALIQAAYDEGRRADSVDRVIQELEAESSDLSLNLVEWAGKVGANPNYLSRRFKEKNKEGFSQYYRRLRMERAKRLLAQTDRSIAQISSALGYYDAKHFCRVFKTYANLTPTEYRNAHRKKTL